MKLWGLRGISNLFLLVAIAGGLATAGWATETGELFSDARDGLHTQSPALLVQADEVLGLGSTGAVVKDLQAMLALMGYYSGAVDGVYEQMTLDAVRQFQIDAGLTADGVVGPLTWRRLLPTPATLSNPQAPNDGHDSTSLPEDSNRPNEASSGSNAIAQTAGNLPILKLDDAGEDVSRLQGRLTTLNLYTGPVDGVFGVQTEEAVQKFQSQTGLTVDGIVGPATWLALFR